MDFISKGNTRRIAAALRKVLQTVTPSATQPSNDVVETEDVTELTRRALGLLAGQHDASAQEALALAIIANRDYHHVLLAPESTDAEESMHGVEALARHDTDFTAGLLRAADAADRCKARALRMIEWLGRTAVAAQWVRRMTEHPDPNVRSKAVKMLACLHVNVALIERQLASIDARVRANAVEALWGEQSHRHKQLLEKAAADPHHRVSANGLLGLFRANAPGIMERISRAAESGSPQHRAAIAWLMGKTGRPEFIPELEALERDAEDCVRSSASRALQSLSRGAADARLSEISVAASSHF